MRVSVSFLSCKDILNSIKKLSLTDCDYIHLDFIDGSFVDGSKIPFRKLKKIPKVSSKRLDIHLMTKKLDKYIPKFSLLNCEYITFHLEAVKDVDKYIKLIHSYGIKCGIAINPDTDIKEIIPYLDMIDLVLVMGVNPGYGGQEFKMEVILKLKQLKAYIKDNSLDIILSIDGGINDETVVKVKNNVDMVVSGSFITNSDNYQEQINRLR